MTVDLATIAIKAETDDLARAADRLEDLPPRAKAAEDASEQLENQTKRTNTEFEKATKGTGFLSKAYSGLNTGVKSLVTGIVGLAAATGLAVSLNGMVQGARETSSAVAELSTLLPGATADLDAMRGAAEGLADAFGTDAAFQIKAYYGAVSAGATSVAAATDIVEQSNKLAIGGITDVSTGVDVLTTATNAYAASGLKAAGASDALFVGMKAGKTTIGELASGLGNVIPIAAALGVPFDELVAGTSALTTQGLSTASAITSLRAILTGVAKPTAEAGKLAKQLGIDFSTTALKTQGLAGFMQTVIEKTHGNADALSIMFGSVEALNAALSFAGGGGAKFNEILDQMGTKAGATDEAYKSVAESLDKRLGTAIQKMINAGTRFGEVLLTYMVPALEGFVSVLDGTSPYLDVLTTGLDVLIVAMTGLAASQIPAATAALVAFGLKLVATASLTGIFTGAIAAANIAITALGGPIGIVLALVGAAGAAYLLFSEKTTTADIAIQAAEKSTIALSAALGTFYNSGAPLAGAAAINLANDNYTLARSAAAAAEAEVQKARTMLEAYQSMSVMEKFLKVMSLDIPDEPEKYAAALAKLERAEQLLAEARLRRDATGRALTGSMSQAMTKTIEDTKTLTVVVDGLNLSLDDTKDSAAAAVKELTELEKISNEFTKLTDPFNQTVTAIGSAREALAKGTLTNTEFANGIDRIKTAFLAAGGTAAQWSGVLDEVNGKTKTTADDIASLAETSFGSLSDKLQDLTSTGSANFTDFAKTLVAGMIKIAAQALILKPILEAINGTSDTGAVSASSNSGSDTGGIFKQIVSGIGSALFGAAVPNAKGNAFWNGQQGVVNSSTLFQSASGLQQMGEKEPEGVLPLTRGPDGKLGVSAMGSTKKSRKGDINVNNNYTIAGAVSENSIINSIKATAEQTKEDIRASVVGWLQEAERNGV